MMPRELLSMAERAGIVQPRKDGESQWGYEFTADCSACGLPLSDHPRCAACGFLTGPQHRYRLMAAPWCSTCRRWVLPDHEHSDALGLLCDSCVEWEQHRGRRAA